MRNRVTLVVALILFNVGVFLGAAAFLPIRGSWGLTYSEREQPVHYHLQRFVAMRDRWDIAWCAAAASTLITAGLALGVPAVRLERRAADRLSA